jgi:hypothetical protein
MVGIELCREVDPYRGGIVGPCLKEKDHGEIHEGWHSAGYRTGWRTVDYDTTDYTFDEVIDIAPTQFELHRQEVQRAEDPDTFQDIFSLIYADAFDLLVRKQYGYGPKNIEELGFFGVFSRLASDKIERIRNSLNGKIINGRVTLDLAHETDDDNVEDALFDLMNYAAILICLKRGKWGAPLA